MLKKKSNKPTALLFVDYEHWYISMTTLHHKKPNMVAWREEVSGKYNIKDIYFFGDFSHPNLKREVPRIREVTNMVIETTNKTGNFQKDYTDFIVLDHIYQHAVTDRDVDCFILFTGDGHFSSVVNFIRGKCEKEVGIYGVRQAMSGVLKSAASWYVEIPAEKPKKDPDKPYMDMVLTYLKERENKKEIAGMTMPGVVSYISSHAKTEEGKIRSAAEKLMSIGYVKRTEKIVGSNKLVSVLETDWEKMKKDDFWDDRLLLDEKSGK